METTNVAGGVAKGVGGMSGAALNVMASRAESWMPVCRLAGVLLGALVSAVMIASLWRSAIDKHRLAKKRAWLLELEIRKRMGKGQKTEINSEAGSQ